MVRLPRVSGGWLWLSLVTAGALLDCTPARIRLHVRVQFPSGIAASCERLRFGKDDVKHGYPSTRRARLGDSKPDSLEAARGGCEAVLLVNGLAEAVYVHVDHDTNGNGVEDASDLEGELSPAPWRMTTTGGGCRDKEAFAPAITLGPRSSP